MASPPLLLAIDLGTSGPKVALTTTRGELVASAVESVPLMLLPGGGAEQDPDAWWRAIVRAVHCVLDAEAGSRDRVEAIACTGQWSGTVAVDGAGAPLMNAVLWMDTRGAPYVRALVRGVPSYDGYGLAKLYQWIRRTGGAPTASGKDSLAHILFLRGERRSVFDAAHKLLEPKDYLNLKLTGRAAATYDSIALHWVTDNRDPHRIQYDPVLLKKTGIPRDKLPDLLRATAVLGELTAEAASALGLRRGVKVVAGTPDLHAAAIGSGAVTDYEGHLCVGTSSWITCHVPFKRTDLASNMASLPAALPGRYLIANEQETAGECLRFLRDRIVFADDGLTGPPPEDAFARLEGLARSAPPGSHGLLFLPWLFGERTPVEDPFVRGGFLNLSLRSTRADLVRAVYEGVALNSRRLLVAVERFAGREFRSLRAIGGGMRSTLWPQIYADVLGRPVQVVRGALDANARGAALLAAIALGHLRVEDVAAAVPIEATYTPDPQHYAVYTRMFRELEHAYGATRSMYRRLNGGGGAT
jgi:xylulokinase